MANPDISNPSNIVGGLAAVKLSSTSPTLIVSNAASSGKLYRISSLYVANVDGTNPCDITLNLYSAAAMGGTAYAIGSTVSVPADATLIAISRDSTFNLLENMSIGAIAGVANDLEIIASWEEIS